MYYKNILIYCQVKNSLTYKNFVILCVCFRNYLDAGGTNVIRAWLDAIPLEAAQKIDQRILYLRAAPTWPPQFVSAITNWPELFELRVVYAGNQYRPIGFHGPDRRQFTIVHAVIEKRKLQKHILQAAMDRRQVVIDDETRSCAHVFRKGPIEGEFGG